MLPTPLRLPEKQVSLLNNPYPLSGVASLRFRPEGSTNFVQQPLIWTHYWNTCQAFFNLIGLRGYNSGAYRFSSAGIHIADMDEETQETQLAGLGCET